MTDAEGAWLDALIASKEDEHLEFKEAKNHFDFEKLVKYCAALANEGGGHMVLGVTDVRPRKVVGTTYFNPVERTTAGLVQRLHLKIECTEVAHAGGRVLVFTVPPHPVGLPIEYKGAYWMRGGEELTPMTPDLLCRIFSEASVDYSSEVCSRASLKDLSDTAITTLRVRWAARCTNRNILDASKDQLLEDLGLLTDGAVTIAALVLLGSQDALRRYLPQAEVVFEYRASESSLPFQQRREYREGFLSFGEDLWETINLRNEIYQYQEGLFMREIPTFNEAVVREAVLNAISHRDYRLAESIFVRQYPRKLEIVSPGGFPPGIDASNILWRQSPRNRRIAEVLAKCGLVERSGQGADRMFEECAKESKPFPDYAGTDSHQVALTIRGDIQDQSFLRFLERVGSETMSLFNTADLLVLALLGRDQKVPDQLKDRLPRLLDTGVIERVGKGRGTRYLLSHRFYRFVGRTGSYTRRRGLDRDTNKALLLRHVGINDATGSRFADLQDVLPDLTRGQVGSLLQELKTEGAIHVSGTTRGARWHLGRGRES